MKGLEELNKLKLKPTNYGYGEIAQENPNYFDDEGKKCFAIIEKELKALEIIRKKKVDIGQLYYCDNVKEYNDYLLIEENNIQLPLEQKEFDLLKEVLKNE